MANEVASADDRTAQASRSLLPHIYSVYIVRRDGKGRFQYFMFCGCLEFVLKFVWPEPLLFKSG